MSVAHVSDYRRSEDQVGSALSPQCGKFYRLPRFRSPKGIVCVCGVKVIKRYGKMLTLFIALTDC